MTSEEQEVLLRYPDAYDVYNADKGTFKIYRRINGVPAALSASWESLSMAWYDAARAIREREQPVAEAAGVNDGR